MNVSNLQRQDTTSPSISQKTGIFRNTFLITSKPAIFLFVVLQNTEYGEDSSLTQWCNNPEGLMTWEAKCCTVAPKIGGSSVWNVPLVSILAPRILKWLVEFWKT
jgi:hypothetical protein